jgi:hypothetical protein
MKKAFAATMTATAVLSAGTMAIAQSTSSPALTDANRAKDAAVSYVTGKGVSGLQSAGKVKFSWTPVSGKICPPGVTNPVYCVAIPQGKIRFILKFTDIRPGHHDKVIDAATELTRYSPGTLQTISTKVRSSKEYPGKQILAYAATHHKTIPTLVVVHIRPDNTLTSTEVIEVLSIS